MNRDSGRHFLDLAAPALAFAAVFLLLRAANQTPDGLSYAVAVRTGVDMWHPHHLIYVPVARMIHQAFGVGPITATLLQNLFWVVVLALAARRLAGRILSGRLAPIVAVFGLLSLRGVMIYSVRVETYLPALACLTVAAVLALERPVRPWLLAPVLALAILYHQTNVLFVVPLMVLLAGKPGRDFRRPLLALASATVLVVVVYVVAAGHAAEGFWAFALNYARAPIEAWGNFEYYSLEGVGKLAASQMRMILPVRDAAAVPGGLAFLAGLVFLVVWHVIRIRRQCGYLQLRWFSLVFLAVYFLFFLWWMPLDTDFFVATLLPLWLLVLILVNDLPNAWKRPPLAIALVGLLFLGNLIFTILPMHRDPGPGRRLALALDSVAPPVAELVVGYAVQQELLYFTPRTRVHEGDALARDVADGRAPWSVFGPAEAVVVIDGIFLRELLERGDPASGLYLEWLTGFDPDSGTSLEARRLAIADGIQLGPGRVPAGLPNAVVANIRALSRP